VDVICRHMAEQKRQFDKNAALHTFSIGLEGSPDLAAAQKVADMIGTVHHGFTFTVQDGLDAVRDVVYHIESYEQIRAAVPMYLLARRIKALGYKVPCPPLPQPFCSAR
jgi:asparagine synthase (glutamine-hydrolysing)